MQNCYAVIAFKNNVENLPQTKMLNLAKDHTSPCLC